MELGACRDGLLYEIDQNTREAASSHTSPIDQAEQLQVCMRGLLWIRVALQIPLQTNDFNFHYIMQSL